MPGHQLGAVLAQHRVILLGAQQDRGKEWSRQVDKKVYALSSSETTVWPSMRASLVLMDRLDGPKVVSDDHNLVLM